MDDRDHSLKLIGKQRLGESTEHITLQTLETCRYAAQVLAEQTQRSIDLFTYDLEAAIFDQKPFIDAVGSLALHSDHSRIHILLAYNKLVQKQGHRLVELARQLSSSFEIRKTHIDWRDHSETILIADKTAFARWNHHTRQSGIITFNDRAGASKLMEFFTTVWESSVPDSELRRLYL